MGMNDVMQRAKPYLAIISLQFGYAGMYVITMVSFKHGMSHWVLSVYRHVIALIILAPFALVLERKIRPKMTLPIFLRLVALGFLEPVLDQNLYNMGMKATSTTFSSAIVNVLPAITFLLALIFRLESLNLKKLPSWAKIIGTVITVSGAMVMTLYKGAAFQIFKPSPALTHHDSNSAEASDQHWLLGTFYLFASLTSWAGFFILQSFTLKMYPAEISLAAWICLMGVVEGAIATFVMERDLSVWVIGWDSRLLACVYTGVVCSGMAYYVQNVVTRERGPVFLTSFSPLIMIITAGLGSFVLGEQIHVGSIIGAILIVFGLYSVVWGKSKDVKSATEETMKGELGQELPMKDDTRRSGSDTTFDKLEVNVTDGRSKGSLEMMNNSNVPPPRS